MDRSEIARNLAREARDEADGVTSYLGKLRRDYEPSITAPLTQLSTAVEKLARAVATLADAPRLDRHVHGIQTAGRGAEELAASMRAAGIPASVEPGSHGPTVEYLPRAGYWLVRAPDQGPGIPRLMIVHVYHYLSTIEGHESFEVYRWGSEVADDGSGYEWLQWLDLEAMEKARCG